jgi:hypothetical protein
MYDVVHVPDIKSDYIYRSLSTPPEFQIIDSVF